VPFVARYRKEATGALDDAQLRALVERLRYLRGLDQRRAAILDSIAQQGKRDAALKHAIDAADSKARLEDLYWPYRPKRRTKAQIARKAGPEPLAEALVSTPDRAGEPAAPGLAHSAPSRARVNQGVVSEVGASVYSASAFASRELPTLHVSLRGAVSIARRLQDPLAELVKIDPQSIGRGPISARSRRPRLDEEVIASWCSSVGNLVGSFAQSLREWQANAHLGTVSV
jgi:transcriptional accessory protein Tex/SPT6